MPGHSFLIGRSASAPGFAKAWNDIEVGYSSDWVPLGWLAMFEARDVQVVEEPPDSETYDPDLRQSCPTLIKRRDAALKTLHRRSGQLSKILPAALRGQLQELEEAISATPQPHVQVLLTDLDEFVSYPGSEKQLRDLVAALDGEDVKKWRSLLSHVHGDVGKDFRDIALPRDLEVPALVGYLHKAARPTVSEPVKKQAAAPAAKPKAKTKATARKPWWKFW